MATPPTKEFNWALDNVFDTTIGPSGSAWHNEPNKIKPVDTRISQGYVPSQSLDAESLNYNLNSQGEWIGWASSSIDETDKRIRTMQISTMLRGGQIDDLITTTVYGQAPGSGSNGFVRVAVGDGDTVSEVAAVVSGSGVEDWEKISLDSVNSARGVVYGDHVKRWVVIGTADDIDTSDDGKSWTSRTSAFAGSPANGTVEYSDGLDQFLILGGTGSNAIQTSDDGITWTERSNPTGNQIEGARFGNSKWVVVGNGTVLTSTDGETWTDRSSNVPGSLSSTLFNDVVYDGFHGQWIAVGNDTSIMTTPNPDTTTWTDQSSNFDDLFSDQLFVSVDASNGMAVAVTRFDNAAEFQGNAAVISFDGGSTWRVLWTTIVDNSDGFRQIRFDSKTNRWIMTGTGYDTDKGVLVYTPADFLS